MLAPMDPTARMSWLPTPVMHREFASARVSSHATCAEYSDRRYACRRQSGSPLRDVGSVASQLAKSMRLPPPVVESSLRYLEPGVPRYQLHSAQALSTRHSALSTLMPASVPRDLDAFFV